MRSVTGNMADDCGAVKQTDAAAGLSDVHGASQYVVLRGGILVGNWRSAFERSYRR
jgi:hypothetical protein